MMSKKINLTVLFILIFTGNILAQNSIKGKVIDAQTKEGLIGVHIIIPNTTKGAITYINSEFTLQSDNKIDSVIVSFTGYKTQKLKVTSEILFIELEPSLIELEQIVVTANREEQVRRDAPAAISIINKALLNETKATSTTEILNKVSGVHIADFGNEQQSMAIRQPLSFIRTQIVVLEDGVPLGPTAITTSGDLKEINMAAIKSVEVMRGPTSSLYGSEAIGGAINFITQGPSLLPTASVSVQASNFGYKRVDYSASNTFNKLGIFIGGYSAQRRDGYREDSNFDKNSISMRADYWVNSKTKLTTSATYTKYNTQWPGSLDSTEFFTNDEFNDNRIARNESQNLRLNARLDKQWSTKSKTFFTVHHKYSEGNSLPSYLIKKVWGPPPAKYIGELINEHFESTGLLTQHKQDLKFWNTELIGGLSVSYTPDDYKSERINVKMDTSDIYTEYEGTGVNVQDFKATLVNSAAYIHLQASPIKNLKILAAVRYDRLDYKFDNHLPELDSIGAPDETNSFSHLSPKIGLSYNLMKNIGFYGNYSVGFAPPLFSQLYKEVLVPALKPSTYNNYEIGGWVSFLKNKGYFDFSLFQSNGVNEIVTVLLPDGSEQSQSVGKTSHKGVEYSLKYTLLKDINIRLNGANSIHEFIEYVDGSKDYSGNEMNLAPQFVANVGITYKPRFLKKSYFGLEWQKVGDYYIDEVNSEKYEGFEIFNLRMGYELKGFNIWFNVLNLTDELYSSRTTKSYYGPTTVVKGYSPGIHRTYVVGIGYKFAGKNGNN